MCVCGGGGGGGGLDRQLFTLYLWPQAALLADDASSG